MPFQEPQQAKRCLFDEFYLSALANRTTKQQSQKLYIFNSFSEKLAQDKNMLFENTSGYPGCKVVFYGIHDMEALSKSYQMIWKYSNKYHRSKQQNKFLSKLAKTHWLDLVDHALEYSFVVARVFKPKSNTNKMRAGNVLIYCRNG